MQRVLIAATILLAAACGETTKTEGPPPTLSVPTVNLDHVTEFLPFGMILGSGTGNPTYEMRTDDPTLAIVASAPGRVEAVRENTPGSGDFEIWIRDGASPYLVIYDHVILPSVSVGSSVTAGQRLGTIAGFGPGTGRIELQVNWEPQGQSSGYAYCPRRFGTASFNAAHQAAYDRAPGYPGGICLADSVMP